MPKGLRLLTFAVRPGRNGESYKSNTCNLVGAMDQAVRWIQMPISFVIIIMQSGDDSEAL